MPPRRALRGVALGRKAWLFCGSDRGGDRAAIMYTLIGTAKLNDVDPQAWLADVLERIAEHPIPRSTNSCPGTGASQHRTPSPPNDAAPRHERTGADRRRRRPGKLPRRDVRRG